MFYIPKHRKSSKAPKRMAGAALVAGTSVGAGMMTAAPAHADTATWDRVAMCESSGNWSINSGNGFYGGLQFVQSTWLGFGGGQYASRADYATKAEQIAIARRVLYTQGPGAWPVCSVKAGLTRTTGDADPNAVPYGETRDDDTSRDDERTAISQDLVVDGIRGPLTTTAIQKWVGTTQDGKFGPITTKALQRKVGTEADGIWGPKSQAALQNYLGIQRDGSYYMNSYTVRHLQTFLNAKVL